MISEKEFLGQAIVSQNAMGYGCFPLRIWKFISQASPEMTQTEQAQ